MSHETLQTSAQDRPMPEMVYPQHNKTLVGSSKNFKSTSGPSDYYDRPLMVDIWSQTNGNGVPFVCSELQSEKEKMLQEEIKKLEGLLRAHTELLSNIHKTSGLFDQGQSLTEAHKTMHNDSNDNKSSTNYLSRPTEKSPQIVNTINSMQQVSSPAVESFKYRIIAEGNNNAEPIEIQLAEENDALSLNSSPGSGRLEICLASEDIKSEFNTMTTQPTTPNKNSIKKHRLPAADHVQPAKKYAKKNANVASGAASCSNVQQQPAIERPCSTSNSMLRTPSMQDNTNYNNIQSAADANRSPQINGIDLENVKIAIGPNNTQIPAKVYYTMDWNSAPTATRKLLMATFERKELATRSMTGKPSPAFKGQDRPVKDKLNALIVDDIIYAVTHKCNVSSKVVRNAITSKCADENKMMKFEMKKRAKLMEMNKENQNV